MRECSWIRRFWRVLVKFIKTKSAWRIRRFWQIFAIFVTACISGHISFRQGNFLTSRKMFNPEGKWNRQRELFNPYANKTNWGKCTTLTKNETARDRERGIFISENKMTLKGRLICPNGKWNHRENCLPQRKEKLWEEMINLYNKGDCWSKTYHSMILKCKLKGKQSLFIDWRGGGISVVTLTIYVIPHKAL